MSDDLFLGSDCENTLAWLNAYRDLLLKKLERVDRAIHAIQQLGCACDPSCHPTGLSAKEELREVEGPPSADERPRIQSKSFTAILRERASAELLLERPLHIDVLLERLVSTELKFPGNRPPREKLRDRLNWDKYIFQKLGGGYWTLQEDHENPGGG